MKNYWEWLSKKYVRKCDQILAVNKSMAKWYEKDYGVAATSITNAVDFESHFPSKVDENNIRIIHHGLAGKSRKIELMIEMMDHVDDRFNLTLILLAINRTGRSYMKSLKKMAGKRKIFSFKSFFQ